MSSTLAIVSFTGSAFIFTISCFTLVDLEQPLCGISKNGCYVATGTGWPASNASIALRASGDFTFFMAKLLVNSAYVSQFTVLIEYEDVRRGDGPKL